MNELIKQLAEQSGMTRILDEHASEYGNGMFENTPYPELEKFAQLIVRECIGTISEVKEHFFKFRLETDDFTEKNKFFAGEDACNQSVQKIETLFGVE